MKFPLMNRLSLTVKMAVTMLLVVVAVFSIVTWIEISSLREFFINYHKSQLEYDAQEELLRFVQHIRARKNAAKSIILQHNFYTYLDTFEKNTKTDRENVKVIKYDIHSQPPWFPPKSLTRESLHSSYALLIDTSGNVREIYQGIKKPLPESLLHPDELLPRLKNTDNILTYVDGDPYQLIIINFSNSISKSQGILLFAFPLDSKFIRTSQGAIHGNHFVALMNTDNNVIASSNPDIIPNGLTFKSLGEKYLITQKAFFYYGESEIDLKFVSLVPKSNINLITDKMLSEEFEHGIIYGSTFIISSTLVIFVISGRIRKLTREVVDFLKTGFSSEYAVNQSGDEMHTLESSFHHMKKSIIAYQKDIKDNSQEKEKINLALEQEIIDRKQNEEKVKTSLHEKEILLKEIHHRVKNNMQVISSLLNLQSRNIEDSKYAELFNESKNRINSMALVHHKLYQSNDLANIDFGDYIQSLSENLFMFYGMSPQLVTLKVDVKNIILSIDTAIPCGLIINELVSNSLKYAFPEEGKGELLISLKQNKADNENDTMYELSVGDNGIGIPEDFDISKADTLGLQLVVNLTEHQLQGKLEVDRANGTCFHIHFKELSYKKRI